MAARGASPYRRGMSDPVRLYETDFYAWARDQSAKLRDWPEHLRPNGIDIANIAEEIEDLAKSEERAFTSQLESLFLHLLKLEFHPAQENRNHWRKEVSAFRAAFLKFQPSQRARLRGSPKLWAEGDGWAAEAWHDAWERFKRELRIDFPDGAGPTVAKLSVQADRPRYDLDGQALRPDWYPEYAGQRPAPPR